MQPPAADLAGSLTTLTRDLVRIPSFVSGTHAGIIRALARWLRSRGVDCAILRSELGRAVCVFGAIAGPEPGPTYLLNATIDTAPLGDEGAWTHKPLSADMVDGWMFGRGTADSKSGVAIFAHVVSAVNADPSWMRGTLAFVFDGEEHSGKFTGIRQYMAKSPGAERIRGAFIGYPGHTRVVVGCRGFFRCAVRVHGTAAHSGASRGQGVNAVLRAAALIRAIDRRRFDASADPQFPLPPKITVTTIRGGNGFSIVPDECVLGIDTRLTPLFGESDARDLLGSLLADLDRDAAGVVRSELLEQDTQPAYRLPPDSPLPLALCQAGRRVLGRDLPAEVAGPSSVGNFLNTLGIPATSGFGVNYLNLHAADECIEVGTLLPSYLTYLDAVKTLLT